MENLKVLVVMGILVSVLVFCAFAPGICIDRFMLPDGCGNGCGKTASPCRTSCPAADPSNIACR